jgi:roadblock/LC7 domain-containing protein
MTRIYCSGYKNYSCSWFTPLNPALFDTADYCVSLMGFSDDGRFYIRLGFGSAAYFAHA